MRLERLIGEINDEMYQKIVENRSVKDTDTEGQHRLSDTILLNTLTCQPGISVFDEIYFLREIFSVRTSPTLHDRSCKNPSSENIKKREMN